MMARLVWLLFVTCLGAAAWAQPARPGPAFVDSRQECAALDGTWRPAADGWRAVCEVRWSREDCLRLGGAWTQIAKSAAGGRCLAGMSEWALAQQCMDGGGKWASVGTRAPQCTFEGAPPRVERSRPAADAGKRCDSQSDCTYGCVYEGPPVATGADVLGRCRPTRIASGCFSMVERGRLAGSLCAR